MIDGAAPVLSAQSAAYRATVEQDRAEVMTAAGRPREAIRALEKAAKAYGSRRLRTFQADCELTLAWTLLRRYGVICRRLLTRETAGVPWRDLVRVYRRLEARGEIRGGRFVSGVSGEQFALPDAVERLREIRRSGADNRLIVISGADPLNLTGILSTGERIRTSTGTRIVYRNGVVLAAMEGDMLRMLAPLEGEDAAQVAAVAAGRRVPVISGYVGRFGR